MTEEELKALQALKDQVEGFRGELKEAKDQEGITALTEKITSLEKSVETLTEKDVDKTILEINQSMLKFREQIIELREEQNRAKEDGTGGGKREFVSAKDIEEFINTTFADGKKTREPAEIRVKAPEIFGYPQFFQGGTETSIDAFTGRYVDPELYQRTRKRNLILDNFPIKTINVPKLMYLVKVEVGDENPVAGDPGGAAWIVSGGEKPMRSFRVTTGEVEAKKVAIFGTVEDKLLRDVASLENWIREDFMDEMREAYNDALLNNDVAVNADAPIGLKSSAVLFEATPAFDGKVSNPNYIDAIVAGAAFMDDNKEQPLKAFVSGDVWYAMHILKDTDDKYKNNNLVYTNTNGQLFIAGVEVVKSDREDIPSTHLLMTAANVGFKIYNYGDAVFERGLNADDFRHDRTSFRGYQEVLSYIPIHKLNGVMYDTFANIFADIAIPAPENP